MKPKRMTVGRSSRRRSYGGSSLKIGLAACLEPMLRKGRVKRGLFPGVMGEACGWAVDRKSPREKDGGQWTVALWLDHSPGEPLEVLSKGTACARP